MLIVDAPLKHLCLLFLVSVHCIISSKIDVMFLKHETKSARFLFFWYRLPLAATGGMDGKLIIWDMHSYQPRSTCEHEVCYHNSE